jgi:hypothetical protein
MLYRRFGYLQSRLILDKQEELRKLEESLDKMDRRHTDSDPFRLCSAKMKIDEFANERKSLMSEIETSFCSYGKYKSTS